MTWILYLYDEDDVEIGWVVADPYDYEITHPDGSEAWSRLTFRLDRCENPTGAMESDHFVTGDVEWRIQMENRLDLSTPKKHLEVVQERVENVDPLAYTELVDE